MDLEELIADYEELLCKLKFMEDKISDMKDIVDEKYIERPRDLYEEYGISERDFLQGGSMENNKVKKSYRIKKFICEELEEVLKDLNVSETHFVEMALIEKINNIKKYEKVTNQVLTQYLFWYKIIIKEG